MEFKRLYKKIDKIKEIFYPNYERINQCKDSQFNLITDFNLRNFERRLELIECLERNVNNTLIKNVVIFMDDETSHYVFSHPKIIPIVSSGRMKFSDAFSYANDHFSGEYCIIANADIYFDNTLLNAVDYLETDFGKPVFLAITRHNVFPDGRIQLGICGKYGYLKHGRVGQTAFDSEGGEFDWGSQDTWIFTSPIKRFVIESSAFEIGRVNCDGYLAWIANTRGYKLINPCYEIITRHLHNVLAYVPYNDDTDIRKSRVEGPNLMLNPDGSGNKSVKCFVQGDSPEGKVKIYATYTDSHEKFLKRYFLSSIRDNYFLVLKKFDQKCQSGEFESKGWIEAIINKTEFIIDAVKENMGSYFIFSDVDVQFFEKTQEFLEKAIVGKDIVFQQDTKFNFSKHKRPMPCTGFFICRGNEKTLKLWQDVLETVKKDYINEQIVIANLIDTEQHGVDVGFLPEIFWGPGKNYGVNGFNWKPGISLNLPEGILLHHANWTRGIENKISQLEYVKEKVFLEKGFV